jgi:Ran GTPase-activating protein (RanGAP) involved in mRNA processing and transport
MSHSAGGWHWPPIFTCTNGTFFFLMIRAMVSTVLLKITLLVILLSFCCKQGSSLSLSDALTAGDIVEVERQLADISGRLDLKGKKLGTNGFTVLTECLARNKTVTELWLCNTAITLPQIHSLLTALAANKSLQSINLGWNGLGDAGIKAVAELLETDTSLKLIDLTENKVTDEGARAVAQLIRQNRALQTIDVSGNLIGVDGIKLIHDALKQNSTITFLYANPNPCIDHAEGWKAIEDIRELCEVCGLIF